MTEKFFNFQKFLEETKSSLLKPADYFEAMPRYGGIVEPVIKSLIYAFVASLITFLWGVILPTASFGAMGGIIGGSVNIGGSILYIFYSLAGLFIGGAIVLVLSSICNGNTNYETNVRVTASLMVLSPIYALVGFLSWASLWLGSIAGLAVFLYGFWMLYHALVKALGAKEGPAKMLTVVLAVIPTLVILSTLICARIVLHKSHEPGINTPSSVEEDVMKVDTQDGSGRPDGEPVQMNGGADENYPDVNNAGDDTGNR